MNLLLDECVTKRLRQDLVGHSVTTVEEAGLKGLKNGRLLKAASELFDALITVDKNLEYQQNLKLLPIPVFVLNARDARYPSLKTLAPALLERLRDITRPEVIRIEG